MSTLFLKTFSSLKNLMKLKHAKLLTHFAQMGIDEDSIIGSISYAKHRLDKIGAPLRQKLIRALVGLLKLLGSPGTTIEEIHVFLSKISSLIHEIECKAARLDRLKRHEIEQLIARDNIAIQDAIYRANNQIEATKLEKSHKQQDVQAFLFRQRQAKELKAAALLRQFHLFLEQSTEYATQFFHSLTQPSVLLNPQAKRSSLSWMFNHQMRKQPKLVKAQQERMAPRPRHRSFKPLAHTWPVVISR